MPGLFWSARPITILSVKRSTSSSRVIGVGTCTAALWGTPGRHCPGRTAPRHAGLGAAGGGSLEPGVATIVDSASARSQRDEGTGCR